MEAKKRIFKEMLEKISIPADLSREEWRALLSPMLEYVYDIIPARLFRYRPCNELQFDAFYNDRIYAVNAQMFNDPYDCLIQYDKDYLYNSISVGASIEVIKQLRDCLKHGGNLPELWESLYGEERAKVIKDIICNATDEDLEQQVCTFEVNKRDFFNNIDAILKQAEDYLRRNTFIACFSETVKSITMWSHYADSHKGFVLEYDFRNLNCQCDTCNKKDTCSDRVIYNLYPIIYDNRRYDATSFVECYLGLSLGLNSKINDKMYYTKAALYKSTQWQYEKEWRLFLNKDNSIGLSCLNIKVKPVAIYYGNDISAINKKILSGMAKEKGIKEYQMYIDTQSDRYSMKYRRL
ncbi:DUF2971 domain-containing protein [uncultured Bacteroides sp.]|uniref:DUF2971 domain-containing protein n=1 Tax=uncultured Bacteroides sp. TaxID=162156 RepID=UPI00259AABCB|nr:DUF2971 domain-containing protein [uncultured Bacteroides sp.]